MTKLDPTGLFQLTARLRRAFPRHEDVLAVCAEAERLAVVKVPEGRRPKRDRAAYMRRWRAEQRAV